jgi:hypothetical protein
VQSDQGYPCHDILLNNALAIEIHRSLGDRQGGLNRRSRQRLLVVLVDSDAKHLVAN